MIFKTICDGKEQTFDGFRSANAHLPLHLSGDSEELLVVAWCLDGGPELWYIDKHMPELAMDELRRYYRMDGFDKTTRLQLWQRPQEANFCEI